MEQLGLFDAPPAPAPVVARATPPAVAPERARPTSGTKRNGKAKPAEPPPPPCVIAEPQLPPIGAFAKIDGRWHRWKKAGVCGAALGWEVVRPPEHSAHVRPTPPRCGSNGWIDEPHPKPATIHMEGRKLTVQWSEHGFSILHGETHLLHFRALAACAVAAAEIARADEHFMARIAALKAEDAELTDDQAEDEIDDEGDDEREPPAAPPPPAPKADAETQESQFHKEGREARETGLLRQLPSYFLEPERDPRYRARRDANKAEWLAGWDAGQDPAPKWSVTGAELAPDAADLVASYCQKIDDAWTRARFGAWLKSCLKRKRECRDHYSKQEKAEHAKRKLDRTDVRRAYRTICPRSFAAVAADAWTVADEYDRLCRSGDNEQRRKALCDALDELMIEANGGTSFGVKAYNGPKRLMKALRVRARADKRWPMWGLEGRFRFQWRGLTMIHETRWGGFHLDTDRHRPGTLCHSSTGYRSGTGLSGGFGCSPEESAARALDRYVDGPTAHGQGLGGKLEAYQPWWISDYREQVRRLADTTPEYRRDHPAMTPAEERPAYWAKWEAEVRAKMAVIEQRAAALGVALGPRQAALL
jgi:hypothetical protein